jgi:hypothetical protein
MKKTLAILLLSLMSLGAINSYATPVHHHKKHLKKISKPDRRHKENKIHTKKDGTPDKRYKENKKH